jgi:hypothetical protein
MWLVIGNKIIAPFLNCDIDWLPIGIKLKAFTTAEQKMKVACYIWSFDSKREPLMTNSIIPSLRPPFSSKVKGFLDFLNRQFPHDESISIVADATRNKGI